MLTLDGHRAMLILCSIVQMLLLATAFPVSAVQTERDDLIRVSFASIILCLFFAVFLRTFVHCPAYGVCVHFVYSYTVRHLAHWDVYFLFMVFVCATDYSTTVAGGSHMYSGRDRSTGDICLSDQI